MVLQRVEPQCPFGNKSNKVSDSQILFAHCDVWHRESVHRGVTAGGGIIERVKALKLKNSCVQISVAGGLHAFDRHNHRHVLKEQSLCLGDTKHQQCLSPNGMSCVKCHQTSSQSPTNTLWQAEMAKAHTSPAGSDTNNIYIFLSEGLSSHSYSTIFPELPNCGVRRAQWLRVTSQQAAWGSNVIKSNWHISKKKDVLLGLLFPKQASQSHWQP